MPRRKTTKAVKSLKTMDPGPWLRKALAKRRKDELIDMLVTIARADRVVLRRLAAHFELQMPPKELLAATRQAMADATDFDERDINHNFSYDYEAYRQVQRNMHRLIEMGQLRPAMELSLELMGQGSYQVELSDEGLMTDDIEPCFKPVLKALRKCDLPATEVTAWDSSAIRSFGRCDSNSRRRGRHDPLADSPGGDRVQTAGRTSPREPLETPTAHHAPNYTRPPEGHALFLPRRQRPMLECGNRVALNSLAWGDQ